MIRPRAGNTAVSKWAPNPIHASAICLALGAITLCCAHIPCPAWMPFVECHSKWAMVPDPSVTCPNFFETTPSVVADGGIFELDDLVVQALRVATDDYLEGPRPLGRPCSGKRTAHEYRVVQQGDIVFIKIMDDPQRCGEMLYSDDGATYAIAPDGKILHRHLGSTLLDDYEGDPDAGQRVLPTDANLLGSELPITANMEFLMPDAGTQADAGSGSDAGTDVDVETGPDGGTLP